MISKSTVLVLGAGASVPYNFPTGRDLAIWTARKCNDVNGADGAFHDSDFSRDMFVGYPQRIDPALIRQFGRAFMDSGCSSLDAFVEAEGNRQFLPLVKAAMIHRLTESEMDNHLFPNEDGAARRDWCVYLFHEFLKTPRAADFRSNQLKVITFNFDRSFERKLFRLIKSAYGISDAEAGQLRIAIPVLHMHGSLGRERWLGENRPDSRDYAPTATDEQKAAMFHQIRIVHEEIEQDVLDTAHAWLSRAHTICFLGFGYHPTNVARLRMHEPHSSAAIWGTSLGLSGPEVARARARFHDSAINLQDIDAYGFVREYAAIPVG